MATVLVEIECKQVITFNKQIEVDEDDFEQIKDLDREDIGEWDKHTREQFYIINDLIDLRDVSDADQEFTDVSVKKIAKEQPATATP